MAVWKFLHTCLPELILLYGGIVDGHGPLFKAAVLARNEGVTTARASLDNDTGMVARQS